MSAACHRSFLALFATLAWLCLGAAAAGQVVVQSTLQPGVLKLGQTAVWVITAGAPGAIDLLPPKPVEGLRYGRLIGPERAQRFSVVNGRRTTQADSTWQLEVIPERVGEFNLPAPQVQLGTQTFSGEPKTLEVFADLKGAELGLFVFEGAPARLVEGQPVVMQLVFGWRESAGRSINHAGLFLPWWEGLSGAFLEVAEVEADRDRVEVLINRRQRVVVERLSDYERDGQRFIAFRLPVLLTPTRPGLLELAGSFLEFGEVVTERGFFGSSGRLVEPFFAPAETLAIEVRALPSADQPLDYGGAIGSFELQQSASARDLKVGDTLKLIVEIRGQGNLPFFTLPEPDVEGAFRGFQYYGFKEEKRLDRRRIEYDLVPLDTELKSIPGLELPYFDPATWTYRRLTGEPIEVRVRPLTTAAPLGGSEGGPRFADDIEDLRPRSLERAGADAEAPDEGLLASVGIGLGVGWLALRSAARSGGREPGAMLQRNRRRSLRNLQKALGVSLDAESDLDAWTAFLGARSGEPAATWIGRDLEQWAQTRRQAGVRPLSSASLDSLRRIGRGLESASYGGGTKRLSKSDLLDTAQELLEDGL